MTLRPPISTLTATLLPYTTRFLSLGNCAGPRRGPDPSSPPRKGRPPRLGVRTNKEPRRLLKSRQTSSRSGGPSPLLGRRGGSEPLLLPRPQPGSFKLNIFDIKRIISRDLTRFDNCPTQTVQTQAPQGTDKNSCNRTMFVTFHPRLVTG